MAYFTRSLTAMALAVAAAGFFVLGSAFLIAAYATLTPTSAGTATGFIHAGLWLQFVAGTAALGAVCAAGWAQVLRSRWQAVAEIVIGAVATLMIAIGWLIDATATDADSAAYVLQGVGIGIWALLGLGVAALRSLAEQATNSGEAAKRSRYAGLWLIAAIGLVLLAVGTGFTLDPLDDGTAIAAGVLQAAGAGVLCGAVTAARRRGYLISRPAAVAEVALGLLAGSGVAVAVVGGLVFGTDVTLTGIRAGMPIAIATQLAAVAVLGLAAWMRVRELAAGAVIRDSATRTASAALRTLPVSITDDRVSVVTESTGC